MRRTKFLSKKLLKKNKKRYKYEKTFNDFINTYKYHKITCKWAKKCTKNCIKIEKKKAQQRGGVPCKVCGG